MMKADYLLLIILCMAQLIPGMSSLALAGSDHLQARRLVESGEVLPLQSILDAIRPHYPGRVIEVELEKEHGQIIYEIEIVDSNGQVHELHVDAANGEILKVKEDD